VAAAVYFVLIVPMNKLREMRASGEAEEPKAPAEDILLLQEIRDLLRDRRPL
jgi:large conductance mechanosensitive channel